jgi:hypothetical protein
MDGKTDSPQDDKPKINGVSGFGLARAWIGEWTPTGVNNLTPLLPTRSMSIEFSGSLQDVVTTTNAPQHSAPLTIENLEAALELMEKVIQEAEDRAKVEEEKHTYIVDIPGIVTYAFENAQRWELREWWAVNRYGLEMDDLKLYQLDDDYIANWWKKHRMISEPHIPDFGLSRMIFGSHSHRMSPFMSIRSSGENETDVDDGSDEYGRDEPG